MSVTDQPLQEPPYRTRLHALIEAQVARSPQPCAVRIEGEQLSFAELNTRANQLAHYLRGLGVGPDDVVGVVLERSLDMIVALLAVLKAGGAYLPIDPHHPPARQLFVLRDAAASVVLTRADWAKALTSFEGTCFCFDRDAARLSNEPASNLEPCADPDDLAYVIYTSGSTGQPKGCMISHAAICNRLIWMRDHYGLGEADRVLQKTPYTFDVSVWELFLPLLSGACLVMARPGGHQDTQYLVDVIRREAITACHFVPSMLRFFLRNGQVGRCDTLRKVFASGEALPFDLLTAFREALPNAQLHNLYGPTEAAVDVTYWTCEARPDQKVPIGKAIDNIAIHILGSDGRRAPAGEEGELCIGGVGVGRGYLNRAALTAERFVDDPFGPPGAKMYRTGDRARELDDGNIEFLGRVDFQVKIRGLRIELGEIEAALQEDRQVRDAAVVVREQDTLDPRLVAYVVAGPDLDLDTLRRSLRDRLPAYMIPNSFVSLAALPVTSHGKLDRAALPWPPESHALDQAKAVAGEDGLQTLQEELAGLMSRRLGGARVRGSDNLFDLGATSLTLVQLIEDVAERWQVLVPVDVLLDEPSLSPLANYVFERAGTPRARSGETAAVIIPNAAVAATLQQVVSEVLGTPRIKTDDNFFDLGATSLSLVRLVEKLEAALGVRTPVDLLLDSPTLAALEAFVHGALGDRTPHDPPAIAPGAEPAAQAIRLEGVPFDDDLARAAAPDSDLARAPIDLQKLGGLLTGLAHLEVEGRTRLLYPSSGSYKAVQAYLQVGPDGVIGLSPGVFFYHPARHALVRIDNASAMPAARLADSHIEGVPAAFTLFLVAELAALEPVYHEASEALLEVEAGYIGQLLLNRKNEFDLGLRPMVVADEEEVAKTLGLGASQFLLCAWAGGGRSDATSPPRPLEARTAAASGPEARARRAWSSGAALSQDTIDRLHQEKRHLRRVGPDEPVIELEPPVIDPQEFALRASRRDYEPGPIPFRDFSALMTLLRSREGSAPHMFAEVSGAAPFDILVHVKAERIEDVAAGLYRYQPATHTLSRVGDLDPDALELSYTPFNRRHFKQAAFGLYFLSPPCDPASVGASPNWRQAGHIGQVLVERQAEVGVGLCPIGGLRPERWRDALGVSAGAELMHSFVGGRTQHATPTSRPSLWPTRERPTVASSPTPVSSTGSAAPQGEVVVVGLAGRYPGAPDLATFWRNLETGIASIGPVPGGRFGPRDGLPNSLRGGFLEDIEHFDNLLFNISGAEARTLDPQERLLLEVAWACFEDAGYDPLAVSRLTPRTGVFVGAMWNDYQGYGVQQSASGAPIQAVAVPSSLANRLSFFFDLSGPSITFNTSCASAMTALHYACESIASGRCDVALAGGVNLVTHPHHLRLLTELAFLSLDNVARPFAAAADGWVIGEGVGMLMLKSRAAAERDRDHIYGVIKGSALAHSGRTFQFGAPDVAARTSSIREALDSAGVEPESISYIETAASGTSIADAAEVSALNAVFAGTPPGRRRLGSVKGNIGHLESASAISQITKVLLQLGRRRLTPTLGCHPPSPLMRLADGGLELADLATEWTQPAPTSRPLRALVNVFGATGSAGHVLIEEHLAASRPSTRPTGAMIVPLSAATSGQLRETAEKLLTFLQGETSAALRLEDVAFTLGSGRTPLPERVAFVASSPEELAQGLAAFLRDEPDETCIRSAKLPDASSAPQRHAAAWVGGGDAVWTTEPDTEGRRVSLPGYVFARTRFPLEVEPISEPVGASDDVEPPVALARPGDRAARIEQYLVTLFSNASEVPRAAIDPTAPLERYGINSTIVHRLNAQLDEQVGSLPKTLFFEHRSLRAAAAYLAQRHGSQFRALLGDDPRDEGDAQTVPAPTVSANADRAAPRPAVAAAPRAETDIAVIGLAGRYPQASDLRQFWNNLAEGRDCITEIPPERWDNSRYFNPERGLAGATYSRWGGFIDGVDEFDPLLFWMSPREAQSTDPQERLFLQTAYHALEDAGYSRSEIQRSCGGEVGVFVGVMYNEYQLLNGHSSHGSIANRVSYYFDLSGPSLAVDTMCSSSLTAIHLAIQSLRCGECQMALAGGVNLSLHPSKYLTQAQLTMLASDGRCRSFGEGGDGMTPGEGVGAIVLKPLSAAVADGDNIYGVIKGASINHGGKTNGYTVPNPVAQARLVANAVRAARLDSQVISYIEAHGTGTSLGDPIEIAALTEAFGSGLGDHRSEAPRCAIGSVKSNIGHLESAAGIAGVTKVLLQMKHGMLAPSLHAQRTNPQIDFSQTPFVVQQTLEDWRRIRTDIDGVITELPRTAGVSSFGAGGANAHVIVQEWRPPTPTDKTRGPEVSGGVPILLSAKTKTGLRDQARQLRERLLEPELSESDLPNIAYTLQVGREPMEQRLGVMAGSLQELSAKLTAFLDRPDDQPLPPDVYCGDSKAHRELAALFNADLTFQDTLQTWLRQARHSNLLELWTRGLDVDWRRAYGPDGAYAGLNPRRLSLPTYPFERGKYWVEEVARPRAAEAAGVDATQSSTRTRQRRWLAKHWRAAAETTVAAVGKKHLIVLTRETEDLGRALLDRLPGSRLLFLGEGGEGHDSNFSDIQGWIDLAGCGSTLSHDLRWTTPLRLWLEHAAVDLAAIAVTQGLEPFQNAEVNLAGAERAGLFRMLSSEYSRVRAKHLDLERDLQPAVAAERIVRELGCDSPDVEACYRDGRRYVAAMAEIDVEPKAQTTPSAQLALPRDHVLLVTGGVRGLGLLCATRWVQRHGARRLVLLGRHELPPRSQWASLRSNDGETGQKIRAIEALEAQGAQVNTRAVAFDDVSAVRTLIAEVTTTLGPIGGVIHCAGLVDDENPAFVRKTLESMTRIAAPKVSGLDHLLQALEGQPLRFCVLFSSVAGVIPSLAAGQSDYAMANVYMDYAAQAWRGRLPVLSIQWPNWRDTGLGEVKTAAYKQTGLLSLTDEEGLDLLETALLGDVGSVVLPAVIDPEAWAPDRLLLRASSRQRPARPTPDPATGDGGGGGDLEGWLRSIAARELRIAPDLIDTRTPLHEYGADSILLVQMLKPISQRVGRSLDPSILLEHPTLAGFATWLSGAHPELLQGPDLRRDTPPGDAASPSPEARHEPTVRTAQAGSDDIAIIGMSCRFPGAASLEDYWRLLRDGGSALRRLPDDRSGGAEVHAGLLDEADPYDPACFELAASDAKAMDPQALLLLEETLKLWSHAGYTSADVRGDAIGVYLGARSQHRPEASILSAARNPFMAIGPNYLAANISRAFDLRGPSLVVDTACSSVLVALHLAAQAMRAGEVSSALVGGVSLLSPDAFDLFSQRGILNRSAQFHLFDGRACGALLSEGAGMVWLKPLNRARQDGDRIYAVLKATAVNNDGRTPSPAAPNYQAQRDVIRAALDRSGKTAEDITYVEVSGSGSEVTDILELKAIQAEYRARPGSTCELGSMKPNIGHPLCAEGLASLIKVALMLHHRTSVPFLSGEEPMAHYDLDSSPFRFARSADAWTTPTVTAAINCFADGGTNAHVILETAGAHTSVRQPQPVPTASGPIGGARAVRALFPVSSDDPAPEIAAFEAEDEQVNLSFWAPPQMSEASSSPQSGLHHVGD